MPLGLRLLQGRENASCKIHFDFLFWLRLMFDGRVRFTAWNAADGKMCDNLMFHTSIYGSPVRPVILIANEIIASTSNEQNLDLRLENGLVLETRNKFIFCSECRIDHLLEYWNSCKTWTSLSVVQGFHFNWVFAFITLEFNSVDI